MSEIRTILATKWAVLAQVVITIILVFAGSFYELLPISETPYIVALAILSMKLQGQGWKKLGLSRPRNWRKTIVIALCIAILVQIFDELILEDLIYRIVGSKPDLSDFEAIHGNTQLLIIYFMLIWTLAALGEEIAHRGFLLTKTAELLEPSPLRWIIGIAVSSVVFGLAHYYKGPAGMIDSGLSGAIFGTLYVVSGRNLWLCIFTHGFVDTYGLLYFYFGFYSN